MKKLVGTMEQDIYLVGRVVNDDSFKDGFVDKILEIRDGIYDEYGSYPTLGVSSNTSSWIRRVFGNDSAYVRDQTESFWTMQINIMDMRDGLIDFYIEVADVIG